MNTEPKSSGERVEVESDLSNYTTKSDLKNATGVATSKFAKKVDLARLDLKSVEIRIFESSVLKILVQK